MRPFPNHVLPDPLRLFVTEASESVGCDPAFVALPLLAGLASAIGNSRRVRLKADWCEPSILWCAIVGESGTVKSPAIELPLQPLRDRQQRAMTEHAEAVRAWKIDHDRWKVAHREWMAEGCVGEPEPEPDRPVCERFIIDDVTTEAVVLRLRENPRGLVLARDELSGWFGSFDRYTGSKGGDAPKWLECFGARPLTVDRKGGETLYVSRASVSICGGVQPEILRRALSGPHRESGLAARFLFAYPPRRPKRWTDREVSRETSNRLWSIYANLLALEPEGDDDDVRPVDVRLDPEARAAFVRFVDEHGEATYERDGDEAAAFSKLEGYAARLAMVLHLARWAGGEGIDPGVIDAGSVGAGVDLARWFGGEAERIYALFDGDDEDRERDRLLGWIGRKGGRVSARDLTHNLRRFRGDAETAERTLKELAEAGRGTWQIDFHGPGGGRPTWVFTLNASDADTETPKIPGKDGVMVSVSPSPQPENGRAGDNTTSPTGGNRG